MPNLKYSTESDIGICRIFKVPKKENRELIIKKASRGHLLNCSKIYTVILKSLSIYILTIHRTMHKPL